MTASPGDGREAGLPVQSRGGAVRGRPAEVAPGAGAPIEPEVEAGVGRGPVDPAGVDEAAQPGHEPAAAPQRDAHVIAAEDDLDLEGRAQFASTRSRGPDGRA